MSEEQAEYPTKGEPISYQVTCLDARDILDHLEAIIFPLVKYDPDQQVMADAALDKCRHYAVQIKGIMLDITGGNS